MSVERKDLNQCIGCRNCIDICPMDVFRFAEDVNKSIIAYPENCQGCGQCFYFCLGHSLQLSTQAHMYPISAMRATTGIDLNHYVTTVPNTYERMAHTGEYASEAENKQG